MAQIAPALLQQPLLIRLKKPLRAEQAKGGVEDLDGLGSRLDLACGGDALPGGKLEYLRREFDNDLARRNLRTVVL